MDFKSAGKQIVRGISWLFLTGGTIIFFVGGKALHEFYTVNIVAAELEGITLGGTMMFAGLALKLGIGDPIRKRKK